MNPYLIAELLAWITIPTKMLDMIFLVIGGFA
jgi:hypothetical protein